MTAEPGRSVAAALHDAKAAGLERLDAQLLLGHVLGRPREWLLAHDEFVLDARASSAWDALAARRAAGEPVAYLVGMKAFHGIELRVDRHVLVPRPETEGLVDWALERLAADGGRRVVDLGTGSGAIALAIKQAAPHAEVTATDLDPAALAVATANAARLGLAVAVRQGAWWRAVAGDRFDLAVANPPYIAAGDPHLAALRHEPTLALTPGGDGLGALRDIVAGAAGHLAAGGWLMLEHGHDQADAVRALLTAHGFGQVETRRDLAGLPRCTAGRR